MDQGTYKYQTCLSLDNHDFPYITYAKGAREAEELRYAYFSGSWHIEIVDEEGNVGKMSSSTLDKSGRIHISYSDQSNRHLKYARLITPRLQISSGDYNGDGIPDIAIFRPSSGLWAVRDLGRIYFGTSGDIPVSGDYNGDGCSDIAIFRPSTGLWAVQEYTRCFFGTDGDIPMPGIYRWYGSALAKKSWKAQIAIFRPSNGLWAIRGNTRFYYGMPGSIPLSADFDGNSLDDTAIFLPANGLWTIRNLTRFYFGSRNDIPVTH